MHSHIKPITRARVMIALIPALGNDRFESIEVMREKAAILRSLPYDTLAYGRNLHAVEWLEYPPEEVAPESFALYPNYPNPFNNSTTIRFDILEQSLATLKVYNLLGQEAAVLIDEVLLPDSYEISWDGFDMPSGIYFVRLKAGGFVKTRKVVLQR